MKIYVSDLSFDAEDQELQSLFEAYGEVSSANIILDKFTQKSRGFGFVEMPQRAEAEKAIEELQGAILRGRAIRVAEARERTQNNRPGSSWGGGRSSRY